MSLALMGVLLMGIGNGGVVWAEQTVPSGLTAVLVAAIPFWMVGIERVMHGGERLTARRMGGLVLGFSGIVLLVWPELRLGEGRSFLVGRGGDTSSPASAGRLARAWRKRRGAEENVLAAAAMQMVFAGLALMVVGSARGEWSELAFNPRTSLALAYLIVVGSIVGYSAYAFALKHLPVATVSLYAYANPVIAVVLGASDTRRAHRLADSRRRRRDTRRQRDGQIWRLKLWQTFSYHATRIGAACAVNLSASNRAVRRPVCRPPADQEHHDGDDQQNVDEVAHRIAADDAEQPQHDQDDRNCFQHGSPLLQKMLVGPHSLRVLTHSAPLGLAQVRLSPLQPECRQLHRGEDLSRALAA